MRPPYNPGKADGDIDISASRLHVKLKFSGMVEETCIFNANIKVIQAVKSTQAALNKFHVFCQRTRTFFCLLRKKNNNN